MTSSMTRRTLFSTTALTAAGVALVGCQTLAALPQYAADIQAIAAALTKYSPLLPMLGLATATVTKVEGWINEASKIAGGIQTAVTAGGSTLTGEVSAFVSVVGKIADALGFSVSGVWRIVIQSTSALLPGILAALGIAGMARSAPQSAMTPDQARATLAALVR